ncbi:FG-GAP-like repeat-containing protein [Streptomyces sp. NPDC059918]|uniref:FG-GAP-like repeat-containing protein n=1 Tax=unclassified Streptomyces TaxID=2593676 RepID=UPI003653273C
MDRLRGWWHVTPSWAVVVSLLGSMLTVVPGLAASAAEGPPSPPRPLGIPDTSVVAASGQVGQLGGAWSVGPHGALSYAVPLDVPAGRAGVQPRLSLQYSGGLGNGLLGVGWSLQGLSSITRCTGTFASDGKPSGVGFDAGDRFCLDGTKLKSVSGTYGASGSEYRTESDDFAKIVAGVAGPPGTRAIGPATFTVYRKDGRISTYTAKSAPRTSSGVTLTADKAPQAGDVSSGQERALWLLSSEKDRSGNEITYDYVNASAPSGVQFLIDKITYTVREGEEGRRYVKFDYEDRADDSLGFQSGVRYETTKRVKSIGMYAPNPAKTELVWRYDLDYMASPAGRSLLGAVVKSAPSGARLLGKRFDWDSLHRGGVPEFKTEVLPETEPEPLVSLNSAMHVLDLNGDGLDDLVYTRSGLSARVRLGERGSSGAVSPLKRMYELESGKNNWLSASDLTLSRPLDMEPGGASEFAVRYGASGDPEGEWSGKLMRWNEDTDRFDAVADLPDPDLAGFADMDGDGRTDMVGHGTSKEVPSITLNTGGAFGSTSWKLAGTPVGTPRASDLDGDGRTELMTSSGKLIRLDNALPVLEDYTRQVGSDRFYRALPPGNSLAMHQHSGQQPMSSSYQSVGGDFNGDGLQDWLLVPVVSTASGWSLPGTLLWNTGAGLTPHPQPVDVPHTTEGGVQAADFNNDGYTDLVSFTPTGTTVSMSKGDGTFAAQKIAPDGGARFDRLMASSVGDFNGDGLTDVTRIRPDNRMEILLQKESSGDRITAVRDAGDPINLPGGGKKETAGPRWDALSVTYSHAPNDDPSPPAPCSYPQVCVGRGTPVVRRIDSRESWVDVAAKSGKNPNDWATPNSTFYSYKDARSDVRGQGFLGFAEMRVWNPQRPSEKIVTFDNQTRVYDRYYPYAGRPKTTTEIVPILTPEQVGNKPATATARVTRTDQTYAVKRLNNDATYAVLSDAVTTKAWEEPVSLDWADTASAHVGEVAEPAKPLSKTTAESKFDDYGNPTQTSTSVMDGSTTSTTTAYDNRVPDWLISLPTVTTVKSVAQGKPTGPLSPTGPLAGPLTGQLAGSAAAPSLRPSVTRTTENHYDSLGRLDTVWTEKDSKDDDVRQTLSFALDNAGLVTTATTKTPGMADRVTHTERKPVFDKQPDERIHPSLVWSDHSNAAHRPAQWTATHPAYGVTVASMDANGVQSSVVIDDLGRTVSTTADGQGTTQFTYDTRQDKGGGTNGTTVTTTHGPLTSTTATDGLGRTLTSTSKGFDGKPVTTSTTYDPLDRIASQTAPAPGGTTTYTYDSLGRTLTTTGPDGKTASSSYTFDTVTTLDATGVKTKTTHNPDGKTASVTRTLAAAKPDSNGPISTTPPSLSTDLTTSYAYGPFEVLDSVTDSKANTASYTHDVLGRRTKNTDPDRGTTTVQYYGTGEVRNEKHPASGDNTAFTYDDLGRMITKTTGDGTSTFAYDTADHGIGRLATATSPDKIAIGYRYDSAGRQTGTDYTDQTTNTTYSLDQHYDALGRNDTTTYPALYNNTTVRPVLTRAYNSNGHPHTVTATTTGTAETLSTVKTRNPDGTLDTLALGSGTSAMTIHNTYDTPTGRLKKTTVTADTNNTTLQDLTYTYLDNGALHERQDAVNQRKDVYGYDSLHRLTDWKLTDRTTTSTTAYAYDNLDNPTKIIRDGKTTEERGFGASGGTQPHTLTSLTPVGKPAIAYSYDAHGRRISGNGNTLTYTSFDLPKKITSGSRTTTYRYDAHGQRVHESSTDGASVFSIPGAYEHRTTTKAGKTASVDTYSYGGTAQAVYDGTKSTLQYKLTDKLGSTTATVTNAAIDQKIFYDPFGTPTNPDGTSLTPTLAANTPGFTGHQHDTEYGLINMKGREYDPQTHTFLTPDPLGAPSANLYTYVENNPTNGTDPSGYTTCNTNECVRQAYDNSVQASFEEFASAGEAYENGGSHGLASHQVNYRASQFEQNANYTDPQYNAISGYIVRDAPASEGPPSSGAAPAAQTTPTSVPVDTTPKYTCAGFLCSDSPFTDYVVKPTVEVINLLLGGGDAGVPGYDDRFGSTQKSNEGNILATSPTTPSSSEILLNTIQGAIEVVPGFEASAISKAEARTAASAATAFGNDLPDSLISIGNSKRVPGNTIFQYENGTVTISAGLQGREDAVLIVAHGSSRNAGLNVAPEGTVIHFFAEDGYVLEGDRGIAVMAGGPGAPYPTESILPGMSYRNIFVTPPTGFSVPRTAMFPLDRIPLSRMLRPNMGDVCVVACRGRLFP